MNAKHQRALIWTGVVMANIFTLAFVYLMEFWPLPAPTMDATQVLELYTRHNLQFRFGVVLMCLTSCFFLLWTVVICGQMARLEKGFPTWAVLAGLAGTLGTWLFAFPPILWGVAAFMVERNPEITLFMHQFGFICFVAPANFFLLQTVPIAVVALSPSNTREDSAFPRWLGWLTLWTGVLGSSGIMAFVFNTGPFAWNGLISFYMPVVVFTVWIIAFVYCLLRAIGRQERAGQY
jgi:hypothetical protein